MRVLITGATGFIGTHLKKYIEAKGHHVLGYSRGTGKDILDTKKLNKAIGKSDLVYHLAAMTDPAKSVTRPRLAFDTNIQGTINVLESCAIYGVPVVFAGTCEVYGNCTGLADETSEMKPTNPYAASKAACDMICYSYSQSHGMRVGIVRLFNPYGPGQQMNKIIPVFWKQAIHNEPITVYGNPNDYRDYTYVDDIIAGMWLARRLRKGEIVNLCTENDTSTWRVAEAVIRHTESKSRIKRIPYPANHGGILQQAGSNVKARVELGWKPEVDFETGLGRTIEWLKTK